MSLDLGHVLGRALSICWRHRWLWVLGVFGGGEGLSGFFVGFPNGGATRRRGGASVVVIGPDQFSAWLNQWAWLIAIVVIAVFAIILVGFLVGCVAVPAAIWAGLTLDAGRPVSLATAWREGAARFWVYLRLYLLRLLIGLLVVGVAGILAWVGALIYTGLGPSSLVVLTPLGLALFLLVAVLFVAISFLFIWSERLVLILGVGAVSALRQSAWLARRAWVDTLVFALAMGFAVSGIGLLAALAGALGSVPGTIVLLVGVNASSTVVSVGGVVLIVLIGGALFLAIAGFAGAFLQVAYALACRDLCRRWGLQLAPTAPAAAPTAAGLTGPPPAPA